MEYLILLIIGGGLIYFFTGLQNSNKISNKTTSNFSDDEFIDCEDLYYKIDRAIYNENEEEINIPAIIKAARTRHNGKTLLSLHSNYFSILPALQNNDPDHIEEFLEKIYDSLMVIEPLIIYEKGKWGSFNIKCLPAIEKGILYYSLIGNVEKLTEIQRIIEYFPELYFYKDETQESLIFCSILPELIEFIKEKKGITVNDLKGKFVEHYDLIKGRMYYLSKIGILKKTKIKNLNFYEIN